MAEAKVELAFVLAPGQNHFFVEFVEAIRFELSALGVPTSLHTGLFPPARPGRIVVLTPPHEYFRLFGTAHPPGHDVLRRTIAISFEQPGSTFFGDDVMLAAHFGAVFDINASAVRAYRRRGLAAQHLPLGYSAYWEPSQATEDKQVDALFMGCESGRRARCLAALGVALQANVFRVILSDNSAPNTAAAANFVVGPAKRDLLARTKVLINIHQGEERYFEWLRIVEAIHARCVVVSELSDDFAPLKPGQHFVHVPAAQLAASAAELISDDCRREQMAADALGFLRAGLPLAQSAQRLVEAAGDVDRRAYRRAPRSTAAEPLRGLHADPAGEVAPHERRVAVAAAKSRPMSRLAGTASGTAAGLMAEVRSGLRDHLGQASRRFGEGLDAARRDVKKLRLDVLDLLRQLSAAPAGRQSSNGPVRAHQTAAYADTAPRVSVLVPLYNQGGLCLEALDSVLCSDYDGWELVVVDDASTDGSLNLVAQWMRGHDNVPALLLANKINQGLPRTRNLALSVARGEFVFLLDSDNLILRRGLRTLVETLESDSQAVFAYGILSCFSGNTSTRLISQFPWAPARLRRANYIDAMALFRTTALEAYGGYTDDRRLFGWEDYDLYCRIAEAGGHGCFTPEIVGRYRRTKGSMISVTDLSHLEAYRALEERCPTLMFGSPERFTQRWWGRLSG